MRFILGKKWLSEIREIDTFSFNGHLDFYKRNTSKDFQGYVNSKLVPEFLLHLIVMVRGIFLGMSDLNLSGKDWFVIGSLNNKRALRHLTSNNREDVLIGKNLIFKYELFWKFILLLPLLIVVVSNGEFKSFKRFFRNVGYLAEANRVLRRFKPRIIVFANDHRPSFRALNLVGLKLDIPTVYIQHACIMSNFPSLNFTLSLLEGKDSLDKYMSRGPVKGVALLVGRVNNGFYQHLSDNKSIGVALNEYDDTYYVKELIMRIRNKLPNYKVLLRLHPNDYRDVNDLLTIENVSLSDSRLENTNTYIQKISMLIAGDSSIHLESVWLGKPSFYFKFNNKPFFDLYGFVENGLVRHLNDVEELNDLSVNFESNLSYYVDSFDRIRAEEIMSDYGLYFVK